MTDYTVRATVWVDRARRIQTVTSVTRTDVSPMLLGFTVGPLLILLAVYGVVTALITSSRPDNVSAVALLLLALAGSFMLWLSIRTRRGFWEKKLEDQVNFVTPYEFCITDDTVEFPASFNQKAESWPLATTTAEIEPRRTSSRLLLRHPGRKQRSYFTTALREAPEEILSVIRARQGTEQ